jgi:hypothetical protein
MESSRFDAISRVLATRIGRRRLVAAALGLAATGAGFDAASAADSRRSYCRALNTTCTRGNQCCSGFCDTGVLRHRTRINKCACPADTTACNGRCIDPTSDVKHCGGCGLACDATVADVCSDSTCSCGEGPACTNSKTCENGVCVAPPIEFAQGDCDTGISEAVPYCVGNASGEDWLALCEAADGIFDETYLCQTDAECQSIYANCGDPDIRCDCSLSVRQVGGERGIIADLIRKVYPLTPDGTGLCLSYTVNPALCFG